MAHRARRRRGRRGVRRPVGRRNGGAAVRGGGAVGVAVSYPVAGERVIWNVRSGGYARRVVVLPGAGRRLVSRLCHFGASRFSRVASVLVLLRSRSTGRHGRVLCSARGGAQWSLPSCR